MPSEKEPLRRIFKKEPVLRGPVYDLSTVRIKCHYVSLSTKAKNQSGHLLNRLWLGETAVLKINNGYGRLCWLSLRSQALTSIGGYIVKDL